MRPLSRVELAIARRVTCSDFRLTSHVSHNRTERALQLASQHVVAGDGADGASSDNEDDEVTIEVERWKSISVETINAFKDLSLIHI